MAKVRGLPEGAYFQRALTSNKRYLPKSANVQPAMKLLTPQNPAIRLGTKVGLVGGLALVKDR